MDDFIWKRISLHQIWLECRQVIKKEIIWSHIHGERLQKTVFILHGSLMGFVNLSEQQVKRQSVHSANIKDYNFSQILENIRQKGWSFRFTNPITLNLTEEKTPTCSVPEVPSKNSGGVKQLNKHLLHRVHSLLRVLLFTRKTVFTVVLHHTERILNCSSGQQVLEDISP